MTESLNDVVNATVVEDVPSLSDVADPVGGAWPRGWYPAEVVAGYTTQKDKTVETGDALSKAGDSRNAVFAMKLTNPKGDERFFRVSFNYRPSDFSPERIAFIKQARHDHEGVQGKWHDAPDAQRSSMAVAKIGQFEEALGFAVRNRDGEILPVRAIGQKLDVRLTINKEDFNEANGFAKAGAKTSPRK